MTDPTGTDVGLREYVMALLHERDKVATALRDAMSQRIAALDKLLMARIDAKSAEFRAVHEASQAAVTKAEDAIQRRLDLLNEFRSQMADDSQKYALREVVDAQIADIRRQVSEMSDKVGKLV